VKTAAQPRVRLVVKALSMRGRPGLSLLPSREDPSVRRWQRTQEEPTGAEHRTEREPIPEGGGGGSEGWIGFDLGPRGAPDPTRPKPGVDSRTAKPGQQVYGVEGNQVVYGTVEEGPPGWALGLGIRWSGLDHGFNYNWHVAYATEAAARAEIAWKKAQREKRQAQERAEQQRRAKPKARRQAQPKTKPKPDPTCQIEELQGSQRIERDSGSLIVYRRFEVQRPGHKPHVVEIEVDHAGCPQNERCDCEAFRFRHDCAHIASVLAAPVWKMDVEG